MRLANLFFALSMGVYFTIGKRESLLWGDFYYTALIGFIFCAILVRCKRWADQMVGLSLSGTIWILYLVRPFFVDTICYEWVRFGLGVFILFFSLTYTFYIIYDRH